jgi:peptidoglycan/xylan/chitin deacetylase (PgdA/CDA1 family)
MINSLKSFLLTMVLPSLVLTSCGLMNFNENLSSRSIASSTIEKLVTDEETSFQSNIEEKLFSLHCYYLIVQKNLLKLEGKLPKADITEIYMGEEYLSLLAAKGQIDEIEAELKEVHEELNQNDDPNLKEREKLFLNEIEKFKTKSKLSSHSLINLLNFLELSVVQLDSDFSKESIQEEISIFDNDLEFNIYEKNIEHLSHMMEMHFKTEANKWAPSENESGSLSGQEFPSKTWSLTFSLGPNAKVTNEIMNQLKLTHSKATFFVAGKNLKSLSKLEILTSPLAEVGVQSMSNIDLTKVGQSTLDTEITKTKELVGEKLKKQINFYRLPLGAGQRVPQIRTLIAKNHLLHILWNVDSLDWIPQTSERIVKRTKLLMAKTKKDSGIIVFHDLYPRTISATKEIISHLGTGSRKICHLKEVINELNSNGQELCK